MWKRPRSSPWLAFALGGVVAACGARRGAGWRTRGGRRSRSGPKSRGRSRWISGARARPIRCKAADCGTEVTVYIRAKIGFCNCATGVADDEELDRISDFDLFGNRLTRRSAPGQPIAVAWMKGRSRRSRSAARGGKSALSIGFNDRCDAIVATAVLGREGRRRSSRRCSRSSTAAR